MRVADVRRWQWILIALLLGAAIGYTRQWMAADLESRFGEQLNGQRRFEDALLKTVDGRHYFDGIRVYASSFPDGKGGTKRAHLVAGNYFNGQFEQSAGKLTAVWRPAFFIADIPYQPTTDLNRLGNPKLVESFRVNPNPTVVDFLDLLSHTAGTTYSRARWLEMGIIGWMACSLLCIGILWPIAINLLVYGSLRRPREEKGIDLSKVKAPAATAPPAPAEADVARLQALEAELEAAAADGPAAALAAPAPVIAELNGSPLEPVPAGAEREAAEFRAKQEDYYPTAKAAPRAPPGGAAGRHD
jgi:hypothetical protein